MPDRVALFRPGARERGVDDCAAMPAASTFGMGDSDLWEAVASPAAQRVRRGDAVPVVRHDGGDARLRQDLTPDALGLHAIPDGPADFGHGEEGRERWQIGEARAEPWTLRSCLPAVARREGVDLRPTASERQMHRSSHHRRSRISPSL